VFGFDLLITNKQQSFNSLSIDRIDSNKGYIDGNLQLKNSSTIDEIKMIINYIKMFKRDK